MDQAYKWSLDHLQRYRIWVGMKKRQSALDKGLNNSENKYFRFVRKGGMVKNTEH